MLIPVLPLQAPVLQVPGGPQGNSVPVGPRGGARERGSGASGSHREATGGMTGAAAEEGLGPALPGMREGAHSRTAVTSTSAPSARGTTGQLSASRPPRWGKRKGVRSQRIAQRGYGGDDRRSGQGRFGACFAWNEGRCSFPYCHYKHQCSKCQRDHRATQCQLASVVGQEKGGQEPADRRRES